MPRPSSQVQPQQELSTGKALSRRCPEQGRRLAVVLLYAEALPVQHAQITLSRRHTGLRRLTVQLRRTADILLHATARLIA